MNDRDFDALLQTACMQENRVELAAAELEHRRPGRGARVVLIVAVCAVLMSLGAAALWPRLELKRTGRNSFALGVQDTAESASAVTGVTFATLPEGYAIVESHSDPEDRWASVTIATPDPEAELTVTKYALDCGQGYEIGKVGGTVPEGLDPVERVMEEYVVLDSAADLTPDALKGGSILTYPAASCYYVVDYFGVDPEGVCAILAGMQ